MLNYPLLPIIIFIIILVPPVVLGFIRGWKTSLLFSLFNLALVGIEIGVSFAIYDSLWSLLGKMYANNLQSGLDYNSLKEVARPTIIAFYIGVLLIFNYLIIFSCCLPLSTKLRKHLFPKLKKVDSNISIISRDKHLLSRGAGASISLVSYLFISSVAATATSTIFISKNNKSHFSNFTSKLASIYTFNQVNFNNEFKDANNFAKNDFSKAYQDNLWKILFLGEGTKKDLWNDSKASVLRSEPFYSKLLENSSNSKVMGAITNLALTSDYGRKKLFLINNDYKSNVAYSDMKSYLDGINNFLSSTPSQLYLSKNSMSKVKKEVSNSIFRNFEETGYYAQWKDGGSLIKSIEEQLKALQNRKRDYGMKIDSLINELSDKYNQIDKTKNIILSLGKSVDESSSISFNYLKKYDLLNSSATKNSLRVSGSINDDHIIFVQLQNYEASKKLIKKASDIKFVGAENGSMNSGGISKINLNNESARNKSKNDYENKMKERMNKEEDLSHEKRNLNNNEKELSKSIQDKQDAISRISVLTPEIASLEKDILINKSALIKTQNYISTQYSKKNNEENQKSNNESDKNKRISIEKDISKKQDELNQYNSQLSNIQKSITSLSQENRNLNTSNPSDPKIQDNNNEISDLRTQLSNVQSNISSTNSAISNLKSQLISIPSLASLNSLINQNTINISSLSRSIDNYGIQANSLSNLLSSLKNDRDKKMTELNNMTSTEKNSDQSIMNMNRRIPINKSNISKYQSDLITLRSSEQSLRVTYEAKKKIYDNYFASTYNSAKDEYERNIYIYNESKSKREKQFNKIASSRNERKNNIQKIDDLINERNNILKDIYGTSDLLNILEDRTLSTKKQEIHETGTLKVPIATYKKNTFNQTKQYINWHETTIPGKEDYLKNAKIDTKGYEVIKNSKEKEFNELKDYYLNTVENILTS